MVVYELHVRGFTMQHPDVPPALRGTYAGLATAPVVDYLKRLGITTVELLPVHAFVDDHHLVQKGLRNYWGYNTIESGVRLGYDVESDRARHHVTESGIVVVAKGPYPTDTRGY